VLSQAKASCSVWNDFISEDEEKSLLQEIEPHMKRLKYEKDHWDDAIYLYREREQRNWSPQNIAVIQKIMEKSIPDDIERRSSFIHILDLHEDGHIKPHIDSTRYCGRVVTGLSLLSDSVMRLRHKDHKDSWIIDMYLPRRSLYKIWFVFKLKTSNAI
jgi:alkylated DNA repair protein alkB family protein 7